MPAQAPLSYENGQLSLFGIAEPRGFDAAKSKESDQTSIIIRSVNISIQLLVVEVVTLCSVSQTPI